MTRHLHHTTPVRIYPYIPKPQLAIGSIARILYGNHRDRRGQIVSSVWDAGRNVWLYYLKTGPIGLGEYAADELWP